MIEPESTAFPVAVIGCGRMGRLHARVCSQMPGVKLIGVYDADPDAAEQTAEQYNTVAVKSPDELIGQAKAVTIAVPTAAHLSIAEPFITAGVACLIEKPLARNSSEGERIAALARKHNTVVQVGHIERFNPAVRAMERLNIQPRFMEVIRISPLTFRSIDVGVVLDMMIHDIDIVLKLAGSQVERVEAVGVSALGGAEDVCNARITFANGCVANLTASRLSLKTERRLRIFSHDAYVTLDYQKKYGLVAQRSGNLDTIRDTVSKIRAGEIADLSQIDYTKLVNIEELQIDDVEPLRAEQEAFHRAAKREIPPIVSVEAGLEALRVAERIVAAIVPEEL